MIFSAAEIILYIQFCTLLCISADWAFVYKLLLGSRQVIPGVQEVSSPEQWGQKAVAQPQALTHFGQVSPQPQGSLHITQLSQRLHTLRSPLPWARDQEGMYGPLHTQQSAHEAGPTSEPNYHIYPKATIHLSGSPEDLTGPTGCPLRTSLRPTSYQVSVSV